MKSKSKCIFFFRLCAIKNIIRDLSSVRYNNKGVLAARGGGEGGKGLNLLTTKKKDL